MTIFYKTREDWDAGDLGSGYIVPHSQFKRIFVHHTVFILTDYDRDGFMYGDWDDIKRYMQTLQHSRPDLGDEVPYSFVIFEDPDTNSSWVVEGRGWGVTGAHTIGYNSSSYGCAFAANTSTRSVTLGMMEGVNYVGRNLHSPSTAPATQGHRDVKSTNCPGDSAYNHLYLVQPPFIPIVGEDMPLDANDYRGIADTVRNVLDEGQVVGAIGWAGTNKGMATRLMHLVTEEDATQAALAVLDVKVNNLETTIATTVEDSVTNALRDVDIDQETKDQILVAVVGGVEQGVRNVLGSLDNPS